MVNQLGVYTRVKENNGVVNPVINEMVLPQVKLQLSESFQSDGLTVTNPTLSALIDPNNPKQVLITRGTTILMVFTLDTEQNAQRLAKYLGTAPVKPPVAATFPITGAQLKEIFPNTDQARCDEVAELINNYSTEYGLDTAEKMSHFIGQIGAETLLTYLSELTYTESDIKN